MEIISVGARAQAIWAASNRLSHDPIMGNQKKTKKTKKTKQKKEVMAKAYDPTPRGPCHFFVFLFFKTLSNNCYPA
jgi:hypothetical protein